MPENDNAPIIVAVGQQTWREPDVQRTPQDALQEAVSAALADAPGVDLAGAIDTIGMVRFIADTNPGTRALFPRNPGAELARRLGNDGAQVFQATIGGNTPQYLVNHFAAQLARGEAGVVLLAGAELLATMFDAFRSGADLSAWPGEAAQEPATLGVERDGTTHIETTHGLYEPINTYPLFENSLRHHLGSSRENHTARIAELCSGMSRVAADNPLAWRPEFESAEVISTVERRNRYVGFPYTRAMNPILEVDMAAALVMTTAGKARELGIDESRWVYLRGGVDVHDTWFVSERACLHASPAISGAWGELSAHTGLSVDDIDLFDIYSCFPSAVEVACNELGLDCLDPRGVTVTGGLPYFGGPGNNYSLHAIAEMTGRLRGRDRAHGLVTANGMYLTKHSLGLYSTQPPVAAWTPIDSAAVQAEVDAGPRCPVAADPAGPATIETWTVGYDREGPKGGIVIARNAAGERVVANTPDDEATLQAMIDADPIGTQGEVRVEEGLHILRL